MKAVIHFLRAAVPWVMAALVLAGAAAFLFGYNQEGFTGSRVKKPDA